MNLLPIEDQILLKKQYRRKVFVFLGFIVLFLAAANLILIIPAFLFLKTNGENLRNQLEIADQSPVFFRFSDMSRSLERLNSEIEFLEKQKQETRALTPALKKIVNLKTDEVSINFILFEKKKESSRTQADKITFRGNADTRSALLQFIKNLEKEESFLEVKSPPSNLLKEKGIDYSLNIFLKN